MEPLVEVHEHYRGGLWLKQKPLLCAPTLFCLSLSLYHALYFLDISFYCTLDFTLFAYMSFLVQLIKLSSNCFLPQSHSRYLLRTSRLHHSGRPRSAERHHRLSFVFFPCVHTTAQFSLGSDCTARVQIYSQLHWFLRLLIMSVIFKNVRRNGPNKYSN